MIERFEEGTEAPAGVYRCTVCREQIEVETARVLTICATCCNAYWEPVEGEWPPGKQRTA